MSGYNLKKMPLLTTDEEAEEFVENADLTEYDLSGFTPVRFEFAKKAAQINMRVPQQLLDAVKDEAARAGMPYQRFIRQTLEKALAASRQQGR